MSLKNSSVDFRICLISWPVGSEEPTSSSHVYLNLGEIYDKEIRKPFTSDVAATEDRFFTDPENPDIYVEAQNDPDSDLTIGYFAGSYVENINVPLLEKAITKPLEDSINSIEGGLVALNPYATVHFFDGYFEEDYIEGSRAIS